MTQLSWMSCIRTAACSCVHGVCDNRPTGTAGSCKPYSCVSGFTGVRCDVRIQPCDRRLRTTCHAFADCVRPQRPTGKLNDILRSIDLWLQIDGQLSALCIQPTVRSVVGENAKVKQK